MARRLGSMLVQRALWLPAAPPSLVASCSPSSSPFPFSSSPASSSTSSALTVGQTSRHKSSQAQTAAAADLPSAMQKTLGSFAASALGLGGASTSTSTSPARETETWTIKVVTGRRRGAGTPDAVSLSIIGTNASTESMLLDTGDTGFERGSEVVFSLPVRKDLGTLRRLHISKSMPMDHEPGHGWFLRQVEVTTASGDTTVFPCNSWLGNSDCGAYQGACRPFCSPMRACMQTCMHACGRPRPPPLLNTLSPSAAAACERNLLPAATELIEGHHEAVHVTAAGMAIPHPDKILKNGMKGVNRQGFGHGGEDSYFYCEGR